MTAHRAFAANGPLAGKPSLTVQRGDEEPGWPAEQIWTSGPVTDQRHLYRFLSVSIGWEAGGVPVYVFVRTLDPDEPDPESGHSSG